MPALTIQVFPLVDDSAAHSEKVRCKAFLCDLNKASRRVAIFMVAFNNELYRRAECWGSG